MDGRLRMKAVCIVMAGDQNRPSTRLLVLPRDGHGEGADIDQQRRALPGANTMLERHCATSTWRKPAMTPM